MSINSLLRISIFQIHQIFNISYFPQFNLSFKKNISFPKCPKVTQKCTQNRKTLRNVLSGGNWRCLKRERDIGTKAMLNDVKTAFRWNPTLTAPLKPPTVANIRFIECCMSSYRSPDLNDVLWTPKQLLRRHSVTHSDRLSDQAESNISASRLLRHVCLFLRSRLVG